jgi:hypothetical protein
MPFVNNESSLVETRKKYLRGVKNIKRAATVKKIAKKPVSRPQKIVPGTRRAAIKQHVPAKKAWLTQPVKIRKIAPTPVSKAVSRAPVLPTSRISVAPLKSAGRISPVGGYVPGTQISWEPVISSNVAAIAHDDKSNILWIKFLDSSIYQYEDFTDSDMALFRTSTSKGSHVWTHIRDKFAYQRIE